MTTPASTDNPDGTRTEYFDIEPAEQSLLALLKDLFEDSWDKLVFGPCLQGAVFEFTMSARPRLHFEDGYLTVGLEGPGKSHFHLCIGPTLGTPGLPTPTALGEWRRCSRAAFFRDLDPAGHAASWGFRMWNGRGEQMVTVFFPNPWLDPARQRYVDRPDWARLGLWMRVRERYAGIPPEPPPRDATPPRTH